jgi:hypothetical protein
MSQAASFGLFPTAKKNANGGNKGRISS